MNPFLLFALAAGVVVAAAWWRKSVDRWRDAIADAEWERDSAIGRLDQERLRKLRAIGSAARFHNDDTDWLPSKPGWLDEDAWWDVVGGEPVLDIDQTRAAELEEAIR